MRDSIHHISSLVLTCTGHREWTASDVDRRHTVAGKLKESGQRLLTVHTHALVPIHTNFYVVTSEALSLLKASAGDG